MDNACSMNVNSATYIHTTFKSDNVKKRDHKEYLDVHEKIILKWFLSKLSVRVWTGFVQHRAVRCEPLSTQ